MKRSIERIIQARNPQFRFDPSVGNREVLLFFLGQLSTILRACRLIFLLRAPKMMMMGKGVRLAYTRRISWGSYLKLGDFVYVNGLGKKGISLGNNVGIGAFSRLIVGTSLSNIGGHITIGDNVGIGEYAYLGGAGGLTIGNDCIVGQYFSCHPENHNCDHPDVPIRYQGVQRKGIVIGSNCWIGSKVTILDGVEIGNGCVIAAGAVVTRSFPSNSIIGGVPARLIRKRVAADAPEQNSIFHLNFTI